MANTSTANSTAATAAPTPEKPKALTKGQLKTKLAEQVGITSKQVGEILDGLSQIAVTELKRKGVEAFTIPGVIKLKKVYKPAVKGGVEKPNPLKKGETFITKDRPAKNVIKARPLKGLKDGIQ